MVKLPTRPAVPVSAASPAAIAIHRARPEPLPPYGVGGDVPLPEPTRGFAELRRRLVAGVRVRAVRHDFVDFPTAVEKRVHYAGWRAVALGPSVVAIARPSWVQIRADGPVGAGVRDAIEWPARTAGRVRYDGARFAVLLYEADALRASSGHRHPEMWAVYEILE